MFLPLLYNEFVICLTAMYIFLNCVCACRCLLKKVGVVILISVEKGKVSPFLFDVATIKFKTIALFTKMLSVYYLSHMGG